MKRHCLSKCVWLLAASLLLSCASGAFAASAAPAKKDKLRIAYHPNYHGGSAIVTALKLGYFDEMNIEPDFAKFTAGPPEIAAMLSGDLDVGFIGFGAHTLAVMGRVNVVCIESLGNSDQVLVHKDSGITNAAGLKKKLCTTNVGTAGEILLTFYLESNGMGMRDIEFAGMDMPNAVAAFISRKVDCIATNAPYTGEIRKRLGVDNVVMLANEGNLMPQYYFPGSWIATPEFAKRNPDLMTRFVAVIMKAADYRKKNPREVALWTAEYTGSSTDELVINTDINCVIMQDSKEIYEAFKRDSAAEWYEKMEDVFVKTQKIPEKKPAKDFVNNKFVVDAYEKILTK